MTIALGRESNGLAVPAVLLAVVAWGLGALMVLGMSVDGTTVALYRMWLGTPVMFIAARVWGQPMTLSILKGCVVPGVFFGLSMMFGFQATRTTSIAAATLISHLTPALMVLGLGRLVGSAPSGDDFPSRSSRCSDWCWWCWSDRTATARHSKATSSPS